MRCAACCTALQSPRDSQPDSCIPFHWSDMHLRCCRIVRRRRCTEGSRSRAVVRRGCRPAVRQAGGTPCSRMCFPAAGACAVRRLESNHSLASDESSWISDHPTVQSICIRTVQTLLLQYYSCCLDRAIEGSDSNWRRCASGSASGVSQCVASPDVRPAVLAASE